MRIRRALRFSLLALTAVPVAHAHPGHGPADLSAGFVHPFTGWDHLLAMVAVGLWAAQLGGRARWLVPSSFVLAMIAGAAAGIAGLSPAGVDYFILGSVFMLGLLVAGAISLPLSAGCVLAALAGVFHGLAHGAEMPLQADSIRFLAGMVAGTAVLHTLGLFGGLFASRHSRAIVRFAGVGVVAGGIALLLG
jgi:urease accessory protein